MSSEVLDSNAVNFCLALLCYFVLPTHLLCAYRFRFSVIVILFIDYFFMVILVHSSSGYDKNSPLSSPAIVGGVSGFLTRVFVQPFDVVKIRLQLQWEGTGRCSTTTSRYRTVRQAFFDIVKSEGIGALWKGHASAQLLSIVYSGTQFHVYDHISRNLMSTYPEWSKATDRFLAGGFAGISATLLAQPLDTMRTRFIAQGNVRHYVSITSAIRGMYREGGILCFYKGFVPTIIEIFPSTGIHFMVFYTGKDVINSSVKITDPVIVACCNFTLGLCAGLVAKMATHPLDVFKKRLQIQGFQYAREGYGRQYSYDGFMQCVRAVKAEEGFRGFYKGLLPNVLKASLSSALHFTFYELGCYLITK